MVNLVIVKYQQKVDVNVVIKREGINKRYIRGIKRLINA